MLQPEDVVYKKIVVDLKKAKLMPVTIERLENYKLWRRYETEKKEFIEDNNGKVSLNEYYLYHGTNNYKKIFVKEQIDDRLAKRGCFGRGIYFSDNPKNVENMLNKVTKKS